MGFLKRLFGGGDGGSSGGSKMEPVLHEGYSIIPEPMKDGGQFRVCGTISKEIDGETKEHKLIRADLFPSADECIEATVRKAKQVIKEQGDRLFG